MLGPAIGGAVVAAAGTQAALILDVGVFVLVTLMTSVAQGLPEAMAKSARARHRLREALARVRTEPVLRRLLGLQAVGMVFFTITIPVDVIFAQHTLHAGAGGYGLLLAAWGGGTIIGSALYARWRSLSSRILIAGGTLVIGGGFLLMALSPTIGVAVPGSVVAGVGTGLQGAAMRTSLQEATPGAWLSLILSLNESVVQAVPGAGILLGGAIATVAGARAALAIAGGGSLVVAAIVWLKLSSVDRQVPSVEPTDAEPRLTVGAHEPY